MRKCRGRRKDNERCRKHAQRDSHYCYTHRGQAEVKHSGLKGAAIGAAIGAPAGPLPALILSAAGAVIGIFHKEEVMSKTKVMVSFDYDNDSDLKTLFINQSRWDDTPFEIADWSVKSHISGNWKEEVRKRVRRVDQIAVICGTETDEATGVSVEIELAQEEGVPYFLLKGRKDKTCIRPIAAKATDKIYTWTWDNLKLLMGGSR
jgi:hypothetical protein